MQWLNSACVWVCLSVRKCVCVCGCALATVVEERRRGGWEEFALLTCSGAIFNHGIMCRWRHTGSGIADSCACAIEGAGMSGVSMKKAPVSARAIASESSVGDADDSNCACSIMTGADNWCDTSNMRHSHAALSCASTERRASSSTCKLHEINRRHDCARVAFTIVTLGTACCHSW